MIKNDELTFMTVQIKKDIKHNAKVKAITNKMSLKEYVEYVIQKDLESGDLIGKEVVR